MTYDHFGIAIGIYHTGWIFFFADTFLHMFLGTPDTTSIMLASRKKASRNSIFLATNKTSLILSLIFCLLGAILHNDNFIVT